MTEVGSTGPAGKGTPNVRTEPGLGPPIDPRAQRLRVTLRDGLGAAGELRAELGLAEDADDVVVARALVSQMGDGEVDRVRVGPDAVEDPRPSMRPSLAPAPDTSFLGRLRPDRSSRSLDVRDLDDVHTLIAVVRAGSLAQRRAAVRRLGELLEDEPRGMRGEERREAVDLLTKLRDVEIAYELSEARSKLPGGLGRQVRAEREELADLIDDVTHDVATYWDGELGEEPIARLPGDQRANLLMRLRDLPDTIAHHLGAVIEGSDGVAVRDERLALLTSVRYSGDPRLVSSLRFVLETSDPELSLQAAHALSRIDDPRVHAALVSAYERNVVDRHRTVLAGVLGRAGDSRGADYVRSALSSDDLDLVRNALDALEAVGAAEDTDAVVRKMEAADPVFAIHAVRTLGRIADGRALPALREMRDKTSVSALWAELEDAEAAIRARMELRGEEIEEAAALKPRAGTELSRARAPTMVRLRSLRDYWIGHLWLMVGGFRRAVARFESAAERRAGWATPLLSMALTYARKNKHAQALAAFRRAIDIDRGRVEGNPIVIRSVARCFLRRAEQVERDGRAEIARGLLEEVLTLDLRRAPSALRFELTRRHDAMRSKTEKKTLR